MLDFDFDTIYIYIDQPIRMRWCVITRAYPLQLQLQ